MRAYLDTSAAFKLLVDEAETAALERWLVEARPELVAGYLLETELRRAATREEQPQADISLLLERVSLYELPPAVYREAGLLPGAALRSLDALHLAAAIRAEADVVLSYDERLVLSAESLGIAVAQPGRAA